MDHSYEDKVHAILEWAHETQTDFDTELAENCRDTLESGRDLSTGQERAIDNIIRGFKIDVDEWV